MRQLLPMAFATVLFFFIGCKKTDISAESEDSATKAKSKGNGLTLYPTPPPQCPPPCDMISFTNASGFITQVTSDDGVVVDVESNNPYYNVADPAVIFNSAAPHEEDPDLGTPNAYYGGPGQPSGAVYAPALTNSAPLGNIVVIQDFAYNAPNDQDINDPGGYIEFIFPNVIDPTSIQVIDVEGINSAGVNENEGGTIQLFGASGNLLETINIPQTGSNGVATINLGTSTQVKTIRINILGSMGFDNLIFCPPPPTNGNQCTYTQGYWKNHGPQPSGNNSNEWDVTSLMLGTNSYTDIQLVNILRTPVKGNGLVSLAHQLIAAKLNIANGADPTALGTAIADADALIGSRSIPPVGSGSLSTSSVSSLVNILTQFNEGTLYGGPKHCD